MSPIDYNMSAETQGASTQAGENADKYTYEEERAYKRMKLDTDVDAPNTVQARPQQTTENGTAANEEAPRGRILGVASIKKEFLIEVKHIDPNAIHLDDDAAEAAGKSDQRGSGDRGDRGENGRGRGNNRDRGRGRGKDRQRGGAQSHSRKFGSAHDEVRLCKTRVQAREFDPITCSFGEKCRSLHGIRDYLDTGKRPDLETFDKCPVLMARGWCPNGWKCRFVGSHSEEAMHENGKLEWRLTSGKKEANEDSVNEDDEARDGQIKNVVPAKDKILLRKKAFPMEDAEKYNAWLEKRINQEARLNEMHERVTDLPISKEDIRARFVDAPLRPSEKRRLYYGAETPVLAPLTTQGNLPFRRLCVSLGAELTWSEMAMGLELLRGENSEWALMKAHESEMAAPKYTPQHTVLDYDNSRDLKFGVQIAANKPLLALKTTDVLTQLAPNIRAIDLNCGCPIDLVYKQGAGSALLNSPLKLERILRGMNVVSREVPITVKIRMGTVDKKPTADRLCKRLILGGEESDEGPAGVAAITLHGRSRQQRYTRSADWEYIASCATLIKGLQTEQAEVVDTIREPDARDLPATNGKAGPGLPYFCGNGDILSHADWNEHMEHGMVDSCMIGRGALIKPWIFEEIAQNQYLDKSGSERLEYVKQFVRNGLEYWGSDELGVATTRRFLLEWLSFSCRYVPIGLLEYLPPKLGERPPAFKGRDDMETLLSSSNYKDWIKISEMFLGPPTKDFHFEPKHKSNSYEIETQG